MQICYYGDDFTGSTDVLEALASGGLRVILFMDIPDIALWNSKFADYDGFGVAGVTRTMRPEQLERTLQPALTALRSFNAPITHYKVCSTFDSSPETGSIGKVIDIAGETFPDQRYTAVVAGSPVLGRYTVFGNHFAAAGDEPVRLDRHPNMSKHPITPMHEADLRIHLSRQTRRSIGLMNILDLEHSGPMLEERYRELLQSKPDIMLFDVLTEDHLAKIGKILSRESETAPIFVVGSSGVDYALVAHWRRNGKLPPVSGNKPAEEADRLLVISGSCSPVTRMQIEWALNHGYEGIRIPPAIILDQVQDKMTPLLRQAEQMLSAGKSVIVYSALGPDDESIEQTQAILKAQGLDPAASGQWIGERLGDMAKSLIKSVQVKRMVIAGGDTSGFAVKRLNVYALEMVAPLVPGGPLCRSYSEEEHIDGLELVLKGGQVGPADFFERVRKGRA